MPQIQILDNHRIHQPNKFHHLVHINPLTFNSLVVRIEDHPIFYNNSNCPQPQLAPATQLAIFLNCASHYGNWAGPDNLADWVGKSTGTVKTCTHCVMVAILQLHDEAFGLPTEEDSAQSSEYVISVTCPQWGSRKLLGDGTSILLFQ
ncbi:hypothetical protein L208DRAFT_1290441 [Tricholoma matsutake]|nr:hypothetical protein L208DRAFT_1290441 [Tricholoma matsutake 945]